MMNDSNWNKLIVYGIWAIAVAEWIELFLI